MTFGMIVRLPVSAAYGTDAEFDLRVRLERDVARALAEIGAGESAGGEIDTSHMNIQLERVTDPAGALAAVKSVLVGEGLLGRAVVTLEVPCEADPDERESRVIWPAAAANASRVA